MPVQRRGGGGHSPAAVPNTIAAGYVRDLMRQPARWLDDTAGTMLTALVAAGLLLGPAVACRFPELPDLPVDGSPSDGSQEAPDAPGDAMTGPNVQITTGPANSVTTGPRVSFHFTVRDGIPYCRFDSQALEPCTSPVTVNLSEGIHSFHVQATNARGTVDSDSRLWTVDCSPPSLEPDSLALFHLDESQGTQVLINEMDSGTLPDDGILGVDGTVEMVDPTRINPARFGGGLRFEPMDYARFGFTRPLPRAVPSVAIELWARPTPTTTQAQELLHGGYASLTQTSLTLTFQREGSTGRFRLAGRQDRASGGTVDAMAISSPVEVATWHHIVVSHSPQNSPLTLWVDGHAYPSSDSAELTGEFDIDGMSAFSRYEGDVDEVYARASWMTPDEVLARWCPP